MRTPRFLAPMLIPSFSGCSLIAAANIYSRAKLTAADKVCFDIHIPSFGRYKVELRGGRVASGRKVIKCDHSDKNGSLNACALESGSTCVCNDEENDYWTIIPGVLAAQSPIVADSGVVLKEFTQSEVPMKAMLKCGWDSYCKKSKVSITH